MALSLQFEECYVKNSQTRSNEDKLDATLTFNNQQLFCKAVETYSDALKYSFSPRAIPHWNSLAPSMVAAEGHSFR